MVSGNTVVQHTSKSVNLDVPGKERSSGYGFARERGPVVISQEETDNTTYFYNTNKDNVRPLTPEIEGKLMRRNFWFLLGQTWWISFLIHLDRSSLSSASTMGIFKDINMTKNEYNLIFTLFYVGYLIALWPGAWISQRVGHKQFITASLFLWAVLIGVHPAVQTGKQLMAVRFLLGMVSTVSPKNAFNISNKLIWYCRQSRRLYRPRQFSTRPFSLRRRVPGCSSYGGLPGAWPMFFSLWWPISSSKTRMQVYLLAVFLRGSGFTLCVLL